MLTGPACESFSDHLIYRKETTLLLHIPGKILNLEKAKHSWGLIIHFSSLSLNKANENIPQR